MDVFQAQSACLKFLFEEQHTAQAVKRHFQESDTCPEAEFLSCKEQAGSVG